MAGKPGSGLSDKEAAFLAAAQRELAAKKAGTTVEKPAAAAPVPSPVVATSTVRSTPATAPSPAAVATPASPPDAPIADAAAPPTRGVLPEAAAQRLAALMAQEAEENARRKKRMRIWTTHVPVGLLVVLIGWVLTLLAGLLKRNTF